MDMEFILKVAPVPVSRKSNSSQRSVRRINASTPPFLFRQTLPLGQPQLQCQNFNIPALPAPPDCSKGSIRVGKKSGNKSKNENTKPRTSRKSKTAASTSLPTPKTRGSVSPSPNPLNNKSPCPTPTSFSARTFVENERYNNMLDNIQRCPVCEKGLIDNDGLSLRENYLKYKRDAEFLKKRMEGEWHGKVIKRAEEDAIVAASCGELFHKKCLFLHCSSVDRRRAQTHVLQPRLPILCPRCHKQLWLTRYHEIDVDTHRRTAGKSADKSYDEVNIENHELAYHRDKELAKLEKLEKMLKTRRSKLNLAKQQRDELESFLPPCTPTQLETEVEKMRRRKSEKVWIESYIEKAQRVIEFMQKETPNTMRLYLQEVQSKPLDEISERTPIPRMLIPYLHEIEKDDYCLFVLSQVVEPRPYPGMVFDMDDLLFGILKKVNPSLGQKLRTHAHKVGTTILSAYDQLYPDTCLKILRSQRELSKKEEEEKDVNGNNVLRDSNGNELDITIMYMVDEEAENEEPLPFPLPSKQHIVIEKGSDFKIPSGESSACTIATNDPSKDGLELDPSRSVLHLQTIKSPPNSGTLQLPESSSLVSVRLENEVKEGPSPSFPNRIRRNTTTSIDVIMKPKKSENTKSRSRTKTKNKKSTPSHPVYYMDEHEQAELGQAPPVFRDHRSMTMMSTTAPCGMEEISRNTGTGIRKNGGSLSHPHSHSHHHHHHHHNGDTNNTGGSFPSCIYCAQWRNSGFDLNKE